MTKSAAAAPETDPNASEPFRIEEFLLNTPLYSAFPYSDNEPTRAALALLRRDSFQLDAYCIKCKRETVFRTRRTVMSGAPADPDWMLKPGHINVDLICQRNVGHVYSYYMRSTGNSLLKVGQWPSLEDVAGADIEKYRPLLKNGYFRELRMATGLASHGVGIGAFVYLRRIFERLIYTHHEALDKPVDGFATMRMDEKIQALKEGLPPALVKNRATYSILSKGLHELDEETCQSYFPVVRAAVIQILEQDFQAKAAKDAEAELEREIAAIASRLKPKS